MSIGRRGEIDERAKQETISGIFELECLDDRASGEHDDWCEIAMFVPKCADGPISPRKPSNMLTLAFRLNEHALRKISGRADG
jgi:hypothetical protein